MAQVTRAKIRKILEKNDVKSVTKILDDFGLFPDGSRADLSGGSNLLAKTMLAQASARKFNLALTDEMTDLLIVRLAPLANIYEFIEDFLEYSANESKSSTEKIPPNIIEAIDKDDKESYIGVQDEIYSLTREKLISLFDYIEKTEEITVHANRIIIRAAVFSGIIPIHMVLLLFSNAIDMKVRTVEVNCVAVPPLSSILEYLLHESGHVEIDKEATKDGADNPAPEDEGANNVASASESGQDNGNKPDAQ